MQLLVNLMKKRHKKKKKHKNDQIISNCERCGNNVFHCADRGCKPVGFTIKYDVLPKLNMLNVFFP
jgi:ribosomal protein L37E